MKKLSLSILLLIAIVAVFNSCRKDYSNETYTPDPVSPTKPDLSTKITASVSGFITDENDKAVEGVQVTAGTQTVASDKYGYFKISNASLSKTVGFIKVIKPGYFTGFRTFVTKEGKETFTRMKLIPKLNVGTINSATGGTVSTTDGSSVMLPANAVVVAANGNAYTGQIKVAAHLIDPTSNDIALNIPGGLIGIDTTGYLNALASFGMLAVELTDASGNLLQIANGKQATLNFPIPTSLTASAPATIPLWSIDETNGLWKEEGAATKTGNNYTGSVSHFSFWNCDLGVPGVSITAQIVDNSLSPLVHTQVGIRWNQRTYQTYCYTDTSGFVYGIVPANSDLTVNVLTPCGTTVYSKNFSTNSTAIDLGTIIADVSQNQFTISGQAVNCSNTAVTNGYAIVYFNNQNNRLQIRNGSFNTKIISCSNSISASVLAVDNSTNLGSEVKTITLNTGINNIGVLTACSTDATESITYSIDGVPRTIPIPPLVISNAQNQADTLTYISILVPVTFELYFSGGATSSSHFVKSVSLNGPWYYKNNNAITVNITQYDPVGGFIIGSFSGDMKALDDNTVHAITCSFKVRRLQ